MNKQEYLAALGAALSGMNQQEKDAALSFCEEALMDRMETGMTEEEAVAAMEAPAQMAEKLAVDMGRAPEKAKEPEKGEGANPDEWQKMQLTCAAAQLNQVDLEADNLPIKIRLSKDDQAHLTYYTRPRNVYEARLEGDTLTLRQIHAEKGRNFKFDFSFNLFGYIFGNHPWPEILLEVPQTLMASIRAKTRNAGLSLTGPQTLIGVDLATTNGGLSVQQVKCISLEAHTTNGGLSAQEVETKRALGLYTTNGGASASNCCAQANFTLHTTNGGIAVNHCTAGNAMAIRTTNGGLAFSGLDAASLSLSTSNSRINGSVKGPQTAWQIDSHTTNGKNSLPAHQQGEKPLSVHTTNGNIHVTFE